MNRGLALYCIAPPIALLALFAAHSKDMQSHRRIAELVSAAHTPDWSVACTTYTSAATLAGENNLKTAEQYPLRLAAEYARARSGGIVQAARQTERIVADIAGDAKADPKILHAARSQLATTRYYAAWLMRRDGASRSEWLPIAEAARQDFRYLAEQGAGTPTARWATDQSNLEAALRFIRRSDEDVRADPLPDPALASNAGQTRGAIEPPTPKPDTPSEGDSRNQMNGSDPKNVKAQENRQPAPRGS